MVDVQTCQVFINVLTHSHARAHAMTVTTCTGYERPILGRNGVHALGIGEELVGHRKRSGLGHPGYFYREQFSML